MFDSIRKKIKSRFEEMSKAGTLYFVQVDRDLIWKTYLEAIPEEFRQSNNCNCCKSFMRQFAGVVSISGNRLVTLWDFEDDSPEYKDAIRAVREYIRSLPIHGLFFAPQVGCGTDRNAGKTKDVIWTHFHFQAPRSLVNPEPGPIQADILSRKNVFRRGLEEIQPSAIDTVLDLIGQNSLYRGQEQEDTVRGFHALQRRFAEVPLDQRDFFCWEEVKKTRAAVATIRNSMIGSLLVGLSEGQDLDHAVSAFEKMAAPANYKRPTSLVTPKMVDQAKKRLEDLGLMGALERRLLTDHDLSVTNAIFVHRPQASLASVFDEIKQDMIVHRKTLTKVEDITITDFIEKVLPTSKSIRVLLENSHLPNFMSLVGPKRLDEPTLFNYGNSYSWSYTGEVADASIKTRVKNAGGKVDGVLRVSLSWSNHDDLDLWVTEPGDYKVFFGNRGSKSPSNATLDVDMNAGSGSTRSPVENICWDTNPRQEGTYKVEVNNYARRESDGDGFEVEMEFEGEVYNFSIPKNGPTGKIHHVVSFNYTHKNGFEPIGGYVAKHRSNEKYGLKTNQFHQVRAITLSPNHWNGGFGNKHFFFFLEGCAADDRVRPFYNEFLKPDLTADRKVFEVLGGKIAVESTQNQLSGIGFSETVRNSLIVEVESSFKRLLNIKF